MRFARSGFLLLFLGSVAAATQEPLLAQQPPQLYPGASVRVTIPSAGLVSREASLLSIVGGTVTIRTGRDTSAVAVDSIRALEVKLGRRNLAPHGAVIGVLVGAVVGVGLSKRDRDRCIAMGGWLCSPKSSQLVVGGVVGGLLGGGLGTLLGYAIGWVRWQPVPVDSLRGLRIGIVREPGGRLGLGASLAF